MTKSTVGSILYAFFEDYLKCQKGLSTESIRSYRDGIRLFLQFVSQDTKRAISRLTLADLNAERVRRFLSTLEAERANHVRTRNQRLSALHVLFNYLGTQVPEMLVEAERVAATPMKRVPPPETHFLERDEITALFASLPTTGRLALRDRTLLLFLYNTGARVQEVANLRVSHLELKTQARVHLHGKGNKWRICPLWQETVSLLQQLLQPSATETNPDRPVFTSQHGQALTRHGIYKLVRRHTAHLEKSGADPRPYHISPHVFRHYLPFLTMSSRAFEFGGSSGIFSGLSPQATRV